jgi:transcriptional regulator with XRE-family HTH domain
VFYKQWGKTVMQDYISNYGLAQQLVYSEGNKLKTVREYLGFTMAQLAELSGIDEDRIRSIEDDKIELLGLDVCKLAATLGIAEELLVDNSMLLDRTENMLLHNILAWVNLPEDKQVLQCRILNWLAIVLYNRRQEWQEYRRDLSEILHALYRKQDAAQRGKSRDKKYAPFRAYFSNLQKQQFMEMQKQGKKLSANAFVGWFLNHVPDDIEIPYCQTNQKNKLIQLAQANNRELKKAFACKS